jgi:hypothetical protein
MRTHIIILAKLFVISCTALALPPRPGPPQTVEEVCRSRETRTNHARVRVAWTDVATMYDDVRISYCILRGNADAKLAFERDAEIVYFALATVDKKQPDRRKYTFVVKTSGGRVITQGPALLQPLERQPSSCRVDVCQFFTEPGERVISVAVDTPAHAGR